MPHKPYWHIPIEESHEPLLDLSTERWVCANPHPYVALGAPYGDRSPFAVREGVYQALLTAQALLQQQHPTWSIFIFDAYRPIAVQKFMVDYTFATALQTRGRTEADLSEAETHALWEEVYQLWAPPNLDPTTPPPHSTGAAVDVTLFDTQTQREIEMGSPIDELSDQSQPHYFEAIAQSPHRPAPERAAAALAHAHRQCLNQIMTQAGFQRHPGEWWHFSLGDQLWAWQVRQQTGDSQAIARYGRVE